MRFMKWITICGCALLLCGMTGGKKPESGTAPAKPNYTITTITRTGTITIPSTPADGNSMQPGDERAAQEALPKSDSAMWGALGKAKVKLDEKTGIFDVTFDDSVKAMDGKPLDITGFMLPLEGDEKQKHFLLSKRTPTCPFCMPGGPTEVIEVFADAPVTWVDDMIEVKGTLTLVPPNDNGMLYQLKNASGTPLKAHK